MNNISFHNKVRIAVHLHIFYVNMWPLMKAYLENLDIVKYDLFVTMVSEQPDLVTEIRECFPNCKIYVVENRGYDVGPFIYFLHQINLDDYDFILKIHTKNKVDRDLTLINGRLLNRKNWFHLLFSSLVGSRKIVQKNLSKFLQKPNLGIISSKYLITDDINLSFGMVDDIADIMKKLNFPFDGKVIFVPGTMFWVRSRLLKNLKENFSLYDFPKTCPNIKNGTLAHVIERVLGCMVVAQGFVLEGFDSYNFWRSQDILMKMKRFAFQYKVTKSNHRLIKICRIPIYHHQLSLKKEKNKDRQ